MVLVWIGIVVGILIVIILIAKPVKTPSHDVIRMISIVEIPGLRQMD